MLGGHRAVMWTDVALFSRRANWQGVLLSVSLSTIATLILMYERDDWFSVWFWPIGFALSIGAGFLLSFLFPARETKLTFSQIMRDYPKS